jgi:hypothetical protein
VVIGEQPTMAQINNDLTQLALQQRSLAQAIVDFFEQVNDLGTAGLEALGFTSDDAAAMVTNASYLATPSQVYLGTATQGTLFDFDTQLAPFWDFS